MELMEEVTKYLHESDKGSLQITENLGPDDVIKFMKEVDQIRDETKSLFSQFKSEGKRFMDMEPPQKVM